MRAGAGSKYAYATQPARATPAAADTLNTRANSVDITGGWQLL